MDREKVGYDGVEYEVQNLEREGKTVVYLAKVGPRRVGKVLGIIAIADVVKVSARAAVEKLVNRGINVWMVTGDNERVARAIGERLGIRNILADVLPEEKSQKIQELKKEGEKDHKVAFVGDGVNDAPALAASDVGIAMGTGTDVAMESASVTLLGTDLSEVISVITLSKKTVSVIKQNLVWAFGYNVILIPVAMGILYPLFGILLNPALAALAMAASSISVVGNSLRLKSVNI
jgi:Cu+-exporting ATPase